MTTASARTLASSLDKLKISHGPQVPLKQKAPAVADSWDDDAGSDVEAEVQSEAPAADNAPSPPPPTPASPSYIAKGRTSESPYQTLPPYGMSSYDDQDGSSSYVPRRGAGAADSERRPEKTTSTASRLIAAGIGQKAPRRTKEEREYDQAMKVQEKKKRDAAREEEERKKRDLEQARRAIWED